LNAIVPTFFQPDLQRTPGDLRKEGFMSESSRVESLRKQAKQWLKALRAADPQAIARLRAALTKHSYDEPPTLRTVQLALARERGFDGWSALLHAAQAEYPALRELADEMLHHAIFRGEHEVAARLFTQHPELARVDIYTAVSAGDLEEVERRLAADPAMAVRPGGPHHWPPILYLAFMRLPGSARHAVEIARRLINLGADPNSSWNDDWDNPFKVITGVIGLGEGVKPPHERADELVALLVESGADPFDTQSFYDISIVDDDTHWLDVLWQHAVARGVTDQWRGVANKPIGGPLAENPLDFMLSLAVSYRHHRRAEWLLAHGANPNSRHAYSRRTQREEALVYGAEEIVVQLEQHGATPTQLDGPVGFIVACRKDDIDEARRLALLHPEVLLDSEPMITAAREGRFATVELLLDLGMDVDIADGAGVRALNVAAGNNRLDVMRLLIDRDADIDRPTQHYDGPMGFAAHFGHREAAALLAPYSRDVHNMLFIELKDRLAELFAAEPELVNLRHPRSGVTPLCCLPPDETLALEMARFLLEHGADKNFRDETGATAADVARRRGFNAVAELLS
jgi:ankyrin repeat protein